MDRNLECLPSDSTKISFVSSDESGNIASWTYHSCKAEYCTFYCSGGCDFAEMLPIEEQNWNHCLLDLCLKRWDPRRSQGGILTSVPFLCLPKRGWEIS